MADVVGVVLGLVVCELVAVVVGDVVEDVVGDVVADDVWLDVGVDVRDVVGVVVWFVFVSDYEYIWLCAGFRLVVFRVAPNCDGLFVSAFFLLVVFVFIFFF